MLPLESRAMMPYVFQVFDRKIGLRKKLLCIDLCIPVTCEQDLLE